MTRTLDNASAEELAAGSYRFATWSVAAIGALIVLGSVVLTEGVWPSVTAGAVTAVVHLMATAFTVRVFLGAISSRFPWGVLVAVKLALGLMVLYWAVSKGMVSILPFLAGYMALPIGIALSGLDRQPVPASGLVNKG